MKIDFVQKDIKDCEEDILLIGVTQENPMVVNLQAYPEIIQDVLHSGDFSGKPGQVTVIYEKTTSKFKRYVLAGLGAKHEYSLDVVRHAMAMAMRRIKEFSTAALALDLSTFSHPDFQVSDITQAIIEGAVLGTYQFKPEAEKKERALRIYSPGDKIAGEVTAAISVAEAVTAGTLEARQLVNLPPNTATPTYLAMRATSIAEEYKLDVLIGDRQWAASKNMGGFLAVAKGAGEEPRFIVLDYKPENESLDTVVIVGKGITFDTGGISIKPGEKMEEMKSDMSGAAAVIGTMKAVAMLKLPLRLIGIAPCTENMPDANAYRPADIVTASNGKTIEVVNTDAEGRMVLADALVYASQYKPKVVIDLATLTGACVIALGKGIAAGLFCNDAELEKQLLKSATATSEKLWAMPLWDDYKKVIKSDFADMKNTGGRYGGVGSSAIFLKEFTDYPWAHIDMAGMALADKDEGYHSAGGTGFGVRLLVCFLRNRSQ